MGWCSGTPIFDKVFAFALASNMDEDTQFALLKTVAEAMEDLDWDCQWDSDYRSHPLFDRVMVELHPDWHDDDDWEDDE